MSIQDTIQGETVKSGKRAKSAPPRVTIVVTPRERWSMAKESLESIYANTDIPFELVYINARTPDWLSTWLDEQSAKRGFRVIKRDRFVTPNEARNIGAAAATTDYIVWIDNDVFPSPGWLAALVEAADETGAAIVTPLTCDGLPLHTRVHHLTSSYAFDNEKFFATPPGERQLEDVMHHYTEQLDKVQSGLQRVEADTCEFHCTMVRRSFLEALGGLDENYQCTKDHVDFSMETYLAGGKIVSEPKSIVTYVFPSRAKPLQSDDLDYFLLRWSPKWQRHDLDYMVKKWGLTNGGEIGNVSKPLYMRQRHFQGLLNPIIRKIPVVRKSYKLTQFTGWLMQQYLNVKVNRLDAEWRKQRAAEAAH